MKRIFILVEGQTEETFVQEVLNDHFESRSLFLTPVLATTKRVRVGKNYRGGVTTYGRVRNDIRNLLRDTSVSVVTTMLDYYGLPADFPGMDDRPSSDCYARVEHVERAFGAEIHDHRFLPFLTLHEYEALIFSKPEAANTYFTNPKVGEEMTAIRNPYSSPEEINEGAESHPSQRLIRIAPDYQKTLHGPLLALEMGLSVIREACPHFNRWVTQLEAVV